MPSPNLKLSSHSSVSPEAITVNGNLSPGAVTLAMTGKPFFGFLKH
jgi:hypothetical protein